MSDNVPAAVTATSLSEGPDPALVARIEGAIDISDRAALATFGDKAHPLLALTEVADGLAAVLTDPEIQKIAWREHGFRGPLGAMAPDTPDIVAGLVPDRIDAVVPMPDAAVMVTILDRLATARAEAG